MTTYYIIYETHNLVNDKFYRGQHITSDLYDGYLGSGTIFLKAKEKYGSEFFSRKILYFCDNPDHLNEMEAIFVDQTWVDRSDTYNLKVGGTGGWSYVNENYSKESRIERGKWALENNSGRYSPEAKQKAAEKSAFKNPEIQKQNIIKRHMFPESQETKIKRIATLNAHKHQQGSSNSQYGTKWINDGTKVLKIKSEDLPQYIHNGWNLGRKLVRQVTRTTASDLSSQHSRNIDHSIRFLR